MASALWRSLLIVHRYLGVAVGLLMVIWFVSGIVMMYVGFPHVTEQARTRTLLPISWTDCCVFREGLVGDNEPVLRAQVENLAGMPTVRLQRPGKRDQTIDLAHGEVLRLDQERAQAIALEAAPRIIGQPAQVINAVHEDTDQWTVGRLFRDRPLYRFDFDDPAKTHIYVSGVAGQTVHWTTAPQRFWNWLGAIPHWLYFRALRSDVALWSQIVIWASLAGTFLAVVGLAIGFTQLRRPAKKLSPYRGLLFWHHMAGLFFGVVTFSWVASGLVSMNPWGFLEGRRGGGEQARLQGAAPKWIDVQTSLDAIRAQPNVSNAVSLVTAPLAGKLHWLATFGNGTMVRVDSNGDLATPSPADLAEAAQRIANATPIIEQGLVDEEDAYYFARRDESFLLPVYRVILGDAGQTRYYLDPRSGALLQRADADGRWHRWLFGGLHRIDFTPGLRTRPLWDIVVLGLMLGGLGVTVTGCYLALRRIRSDFLFVTMLLRPSDRAEA